MNRKNLMSTEQATKQKEIFDADVAKIALANDFAIALDHDEEYNNNVLNIGCAGSGKDFCLSIPNILLADSDYIIVDQKGELCSKTSFMLEQKGYYVTTITTSNKLNTNSILEKEVPILFAKNVEDLHELAHDFIYTTNPDPSIDNDQTYERIETCLLTVMLYDQWKNRESEKAAGFLSLADKISKMDVEECVAYYLSIKDEAISKYQHIIKNASQKTLTGFVISIAVRLGSMRRVYKSYTYNTIKRFIDTDGPKALFIDLNPYTTIHGMDSILVNTILKELHTNHPDRWTKVIFTEFPMLQLPGFAEKLNTAKSSKISYLINVQDIVQIKNLYKDEYDTLINGFDTIICMGSRSESTSVFLSNLAGTTAVRSGLFKKVEKPVFEVNELRMLPIKDCIVFLKNEKPYIGKKLVPILPPVRRP